MHTPLYSHTYVLFDLCFFFFCFSEIPLFPPHKRAALFTSSSSFSFFRFFPSVGLLRTERTLTAHGHTELFPSSIRGETEAFADTLFFLRTVGIFFFFLGGGVSFPSLSLSFLSLYLDSPLQGLLPLWSSTSFPFLPLSLSLLLLLSLFSYKTEDPLRHQSLC